MRVRPLWYGGASALVMAAVTVWWTHCGLPPPPLLEPLPEDVPGYSDCVRDRTLEGCAPWPF